MPDYRVIPSNPIVDAIDRRGSSYMLAGPVVTDFSAGVAGLEQGLDFGTKLTDRILTTQRENDPAKLTADQLRRDLQNDQIREAIRTANIESTLDEQFGFGDRVLDQQKTSAGIVESLSSARKTSIEAQLAEQYGAQEKEALINQRRKSAFKTDLQIDLLEKYGGPKEQSIIDKNIAQANKAKGIVAPRGPNPFRTLKDPALPSSPSGTVSPEISKIADQLQLSEEEVKAELANTQSSNYQQRTQAQDQAAESNLTTKKAKDEYARTQRARTNLEEALVHIEDVDHQGNPSYPGVLGKVAIANQLYEEEVYPKRKALRAAEISTIVRGMGVDGAQSHIDGLEGEDKKYHETILSAAIANSGDTSLYTDDMKTIIGAGLDSQHAADPEKTYTQVEQLINDGPVNVEDTKIKEELPFSEYVMAASRASLGGTRAYKIMPGRVNVSSGATDIAGEGQQSQPGARFTDMQGKDLLDNEGNKIFAPKPTNQKEKSELSLVMKVASRQQQSIPQQQQVQKTTQGLQDSAVQQAQTQQTSDVGAPAGQQAPKENYNEDVFKIGRDMSTLPANAPDLAKQFASPRYDEGLTQEKAIAAADRETKNYDLRYKPLIEDLSKNREKIKANQPQILNLKHIINYSVANKLESLIGKDAKFDRLMNNVANWTPGQLANAKLNFLTDLINKGEALAVLAEVAGKVTAMNSEKEAERVVKGTVSLESEFATIANFLKLKEAENEQITQVNRIIQLGELSSTRAPYVEMQIDRYMESKASKPLVTMEGQEGLVRNPDFETAEVFLGVKPKRSQGPSSSSSSKIDVATTPQDVQEADVVKKKSLSPQQPTTDGQPPSSIAENIAPEAESKYQSILDKVSSSLKFTGTENGLDAEGRSEDTNVFGSNIRDPKSAENRQKVVTGIDYLADTILANKGEEIATGFGLAGQAQKDFEKARQLARDEFQKENKWTAGAMDAFGYVVDAIIAGGGAKKLLGMATAGFAPEIGAFNPQTAAKVTSTLARLGKTSAGTAHSELLGRAGLDGVINAFRQEDESNIVEFLWGAGTSAVIQKAFVPLAEGMSGVAAKILRLAGKGDPASKALAKKLVKDGGVTKEDILEKLEEAKNISDPGKGIEIDPLGVQSPEVRGVAGGVAKQPAARPGVNKTAADRDVRNKTIIEGSEKEAGLVGRSKDEIAGDFKTAVDDTIDEEIGRVFVEKSELAVAEVSDAEAVKADALASIIKTTSDAGKSGQQVVDDIAKLIGVDGKSLSEGGAKASGGTDTETLAQQTLKQLKVAKETVGKLLRGGADNPGALFRTLERKYGELDEGIIEELDNTLRDKFPQQAPGWINAIARATEQLKTVEGTGADEGVKTAVVNNSFRFLDELRQFVKTKDSGASKQVAEEIEVLILKAGDKAIEVAEGGKNVYSNFVKQQIPKLYKVEEGLETLISTSETVANQLEKTGSGKLHDPLFSSAAERTKLNEAYGAKLGSVEGSARAYDAAVKQIESIQSKKGKIDINQLAENFKEAGTLANNQTFFARKLIEQGAGVINRLKRTLGPRENNLIEEGVIKVLKENMDNFKGNVEGSNFNPKDMFGLKETEWETVRQLLGPKRTEALDLLLKRRLSVERAIKIFETTSAVRTGDPDPGILKMAARRISETWGFIADLMSAVGLKSAHQKETEAIIKGLNQPPKDVDAFLREVTEWMQTVESEKGTSSRMKGVTEETRRKVNIMVYSIWSANQDSSDARKNTAHREGLKILENMAKNK